MSTKPKHTAMPAQDAAVSKAVEGVKEAAQSMGPGSRLRVRRACDYCREKRLKCTAEQTPCLNCVLYKATCTYTPGENKVAGRKRKATVNSETASKQKDFARRLDDVTVESTASVSGEGRPAERFDPAFQLNGRPSDQLEHRTSQDVNSESPMPMWNSSEHDLFSEPLDMRATSLDFWNFHLPFGRDDVPETFTEDRMTLPPSIPTLLSMGPTDQFREPETQMPKPDFPTSHGIPLTPESTKGKVSGIDSLTKRAQAATSQARIPRGLFVRKGSREEAFIGLNSIGSTLTFCLKDCVEHGHEPLETDSFRFLFDAGPHMNEAGVSRAATVPTTNLIDHDFAQAAFTAYFEKVNSFYPVLNYRNSLAELERVYASQTPQLDQNTMSRLTLIVAIGALSSPSRFPSMNVQQAAQALYQQAWGKLNDVISSPYLESTQILLLHIIFHLQFGKVSFAWLLCGFAIRIAHSLGLHRQCPRDLDFTDDQIRLRSQVWWVAYSIDASLSSLEGRPTACHDKLCDVELLPLPAEDQVPTARGDSLASNFYHWTVKLARIRNGYCMAVSCRSTVLACLNTLSELDSALLAWRDELPQEYRPSPEDLAAYVPLQHLAQLHIDYYVTLRCIHWASVLCAYPHRELVASHPNPRIRASESICVTAARSFVKVLNDIANEGQGEGILPLRLYLGNYMASLSIIHRNIFLHPRRVSAKTDLEYFRAGKVHLERDISHVQFGPSILGLFDGMLASAENLLDVRQGF